MKKVVSLILVVLLTFTLTACWGDDDIVDTVLDCIENPDAVGCEIPDLDPTDDRTVEEILADTIIESWDGDITHLDALLDVLDFSDTMELQAEFNFEALDGDGVEYTINVLLTDSYIFLDGESVLHRIVSMNIDGELIEFTMIFEEISTGVNIYIEISDIKDEIVSENPEAGDVMTVLGIDQDWLKFSFTDSLINMIEIEVMREMFSDIFFREMGLLFFYDLADQIETDTELVLADYYLNLGLIMDTIASGDYSGFKTMVDAVDFETLLFDLDAIILVPKIVELLTDNQTEFEDLGFDVVNGIIYIELNGTEMYLDTLSQEDLITFIDILTAPDKLEMAIRKLEQNMPWQVISVINLPTEDLENNATITWESDRPGLITFEGVVTVPAMDEWDQWVTLIATITVGEDSEQLYFGVTVPPENAIDFGDEYRDNYDDDDYNNIGDDIGEYLKETVDLYEIIQLVKDLKDNLLLIDFDALMLEEIDHMALKDAFYENEAAFDAFIVTLSATAPESAILLGTFSYVAGYFEEFVFITDIRYAIDSLEMFEKYLTFEYYIDNNLLDLSIDKTDVFAIETTLELAPDAFGTLFDNVLVDVSIFLDGVTELEVPLLEHVYCPIGETCEDFDDYELILQRLKDVSFLEMMATYDPGSLNEVQFSIDLTEFANAIINIEPTDDELLNRAVDNLYQQMPWQVISVIELPTEDLDNQATIAWESDSPGLISAAGVVIAPPIDEWHRWVMLTATVTVGNESEVIFFHVTVPPVNAVGYGDEYDDYYDDNDGMDIESVVDLSFIVTIKEIATVSIPTAYNDVNAIAEDFARFSLSITAYGYLEDIANYYLDNPSELVLDMGNTQALEFYFEDIFITNAFDDYLSEVAMGGTLLNPTFSIQLVWIDGTDVFDTPLTLAELLPVLGPNTGGPETNAIFQMYVDKVNETNFNMTKLLFVYIFNDNYDDDEYNEYD